MREFGGMAIMFLVLMSLSASVAQTSGTAADPCETVVVAIDANVGANVSEHEGTFFLVGEEQGFKPVYLSDGGFILEFIEDGDEAYTYDAPLSAVELAKEPSDDTLDNDLEYIAPAEDDGIRRYLQSACGHWAIGMKDADGDVAMYPMIKVYDCADYPPDIDEDSEWFRQACEGCPIETGIGNVTVSFADESCDPTPAPVDSGSAGGGTPAPVDSGSAGAATPAPVDDGSLAETTDGAIGSSDESDSDEDKTETTADGQSGASNLGGHLGVGVAVAVLGVTASVFANTM